MCKVKNSSNMEIPQFFFIVVNSVFAFLEAP